MAHNFVGAGRSNALGSQVWVAFDKLPPPIRRALHEGVVPWCPIDTARNLRQRLAASTSPADAIGAEIAAIRDDDEREVREFGYCWPARFGRFTPHINARATILRYDERDRHRGRRNA